MNNTKRNKRKMWDAFDIMKYDLDNIEIEKTNTKDQLSKSDTNNKNNCDKCNTELKISEDNGFYVCSSSACGKIFRNTLEHSAEWRHYNGDTNNDPTRCGMPINPLLRESSFGCQVLLNGSTSYEMRKIKRYTEWQSMPYREKSQYDEFQRIKTMAANAGIPKCIIDDALIIHNKISKERTFRALNRNGVIAASIYIASKMNKYPRTPKEIANIFHLNKSSATKGCKNATTILNKIECDLKGNEKTKLCNTIPQSFIERYCSKLNINPELTKVCNFVCHKIEQNKIVPENTPHSVAAGVIYFVSSKCNLNVSKKDVRGVSDISEVTINKCYKKIRIICKGVDTGMYYKKIFS